LAHLHGFIWQQQGSIVSQSVVWCWFRYHHSYELILYFHVFYPHGSRKQAQLSMPGSDYAMHIEIPQATKNYLQDYISYEE
jgi:hypothetical protein